MLHDLSWAPDADAECEPVPMSSQDGLAVLRHSAAHVLAQAVQDLHPGAKLGIGPPIEDGFYYDFDVPRPFQPDDIEHIERRMREIIAAGQEFRRRVFPSPDAARAELAGEPYKLELIGLKSAVDTGEVMEVGGGQLTAYDNVDPRTGQVCWSDLCRGPHLPSTRLIPAVKLTRNAAAYWRGSESNPQLQRIYGTAWPTREALGHHLDMLAEAARRDHRRIGEELDLFTFSPEVGRGLPLWLPNGTIIRDELEAWARQTEHRLGYQRVMTAHYGPKVDFVIRAVTGKEFAVSTNQVDLYTPQRFGLTYHDRDGNEKPVAVIHRAPLGSHERFVAYLTERYAGAFPVWLAPEQIRVIPVVDDLLGYAGEVRAELAEAGLRADVDASDGRLPGKVRAAFTEQATELVRTRSLQGAGHLS